MNKDGNEENKRDLDGAAAGLGGLTMLARNRLPPPIVDGESGEAYARFRYELATRAGRSRVIMRWAWAPAIVAAALALFALVRHVAPPPPPLSVRIEGGALDEGGYVRVGADSAPSLRFSDGTSVELAHASRLRVSETDEHGARLLLEEGHARAHVIPRKGSRWLFDAGPCRVQVTGTRFDMRWSAADQVLEVSLWNGSVIVNGPPASGGVAMRAGQRLVMDVRRGSVRLDDLPAPATPPAGVPGAAAVAPEAPPAAADPAVVEPAPAPARSRSPSPVARRQVGEEHDARAASASWAARVRSGAFRDVLAEAERRGIDGVLRDESESNVMALADAARYAGSASLARRALTEVRGRFPATRPAHRAAFLLGRIAEDQDGDLDQALAWYGVYLGDATDDSFRAEALGRQMSVTLRLHGGAQARPMANEYLRRYPRGAYAEAARAIIAP